MQRIINREIEKTLDFKTLRTILPRYVRVARYDQLSKVKTLQDALGGKSVLVLLWNIHDEKHRVLNEPGHFF